MLVWNEMPSMTLMMSAIFLDEASMPAMVPTTLLTISPPWDATPAAPMASWLAWRACSAFWRTVEVNSSIEAAVSSRLAACCSVRCDRSWLPAAISLAAELIDTADCWMRPTISASCAAVVLASSRIRANTPLKSPVMRAVRSPAAMDCSSEDRDCRLPSAVAMSRFKLSTMTRKSYWKRSASPRAVKSPLAADCASCLISMFMADRLALTSSMVCESTAFSPGKRSMLSLRSPMA